MVDFFTLNSADLKLAAKSYAKNGVPVFPCKLDKGPLTKHGFKDATTELFQIDKWWGKCSTASIGNPTGIKSFVLDVDLPHGPKSLDEIQAKYGPLPETLEQRTGAGGRHLFFLIPDSCEIRNSAGMLGVGLDIRGKGGYVILPPSPHPSGGIYQWVNTNQLAIPPAWLVMLITHRKKKGYTCLENISGFGSRYVQKVFEEEVGSIAQARKGSRNEALNKAAFSIGQFLSSAVLTRSDVSQSLLEAALRVGLPEHEARKTIQSGLEAGEKQPRPPKQAAHKKQYESFRVVEQPPAEELDIRRWPVSEGEIYYGLAGRFTKFATEHSEADPAAVLATFLTRFGAEVGPQPYFLAGNKQRALLNAVLVGSSSKARKGTSAVPVNDLFDLDDGSWEVAQQSQGPLSSGEGLVHAVRDAREEWQKPKNGEAGKWVVCDPGVEDKRLFVLDQEFAGALSCSKRDGNTLSVIVRTLFDGGKVEPLIKNNKIAATNPHVCIVTHITLHELLNKLDFVEAFNGFANRFLWFCVNRSKLIAIPKKLEEKTLREFRQEIVEALNYSRKVQEVKFTNDADCLWESVYERLASERSGLLGAVLNRAETYTLRIALIYALLDSSQEIEVQHLKAALSLWRFCEHSAEYIFGKDEADATERKILEALTVNQSLDSRGMYDVFSRNIKKVDLERAIGSLADRGKVIVEEIRKPGPGRARRRFRLNEQNESNEQSPSTNSSFGSFKSSDSWEQRDD